MKIIILGAGQVGSALAQALANENHDLTLVDTDPEALEKISNHLDVQTVVGHGSHPQTLATAGADDCDMVIAITNSDEVNMVACQVCYTLFQVPTKIARIRANEYKEYNSLFDPSHMPVDVFISPEELISQRVARLIEYPGTTQVIEFCSGEVTIISIKCHFRSALVSKKLENIHPDVTKVTTKVAAIFRNNKPVPLDGETTIEIGDEIFFVTASSDISKLLNDVNPYKKKYNNVVLVGGDGIGTRLAEELEDKFATKLIEKNRERCEHLAEHLKKTMVLHGEGSDTNLLETENIANVDAFCAVTGDDEANIMACLQAKSLGVNHVIALISKTAYVDLIQGGPINIAISPQQVTVGSILTQIRRGDILTVHSLRRGEAEAIEIIAHGDKKTSKVIGCKLEDIKLPPAASICAILRNKKVIIPDNNTMIKTQDKLIIFVPKKDQISKIENLVKVKATFF